MVFNELHKAIEKRKSADARAAQVVAPLSDIVVINMQIIVELNRCLLPVKSTIEAEIKQIVRNMNGRS